MKLAIDYDSHCVLFVHNQFILLQLLNGFILLNNTTIDINYYFVYVIFVVDFSHNITKSIRLSVANKVYSDRKITEICLIITNRII